uniref:Glutathione S-transferase C-terminal domain-containing protein n=1 Tax=Plectus sambesii TaxID=2011161 RepID=A0A914W655_9BILA
MTAAIPKITGKAINATAVQDSVTGVENMIKQFEDVFLAKKSHYIGGSNYISIADLLALCEFEQMNLLGYDLSSHEKVSQWMVRCRGKLEPHYSEITETLRQLGESAK